MTRTREAEDLEELSDCFSRLETDIDSFSAALSRLSDARKGTSRQRHARGSLPDLQRRTGDATTTLLRGVGRNEELAGSPTGSSLVGFLCVLAIVAGTATTVCLWATRQKVGHVLHVEYIGFYQTGGRHQTTQQHSSSTEQSADRRCSWFLLRRFV